MQCNFCKKLFLFYPSIRVLLWDCLDFHFFNQTTKCSRTRKQIRLSTEIFVKNVGPILNFYYNNYSFISIKCILVTKVFSYIYFWIYYRALQTVVDEESNIKKKYFLWPLDAFKIKFLFVCLYIEKHALIEKKTDLLIKNIYLCTM